MIRRIIQIDEEKCNGCGACAAACHEGAIGMVDGKAKLLRDDYCDGLGDCLPACPMDAIHFVEREAAAYDAEAVKAAQEAAARKAAAATEAPLPCGCPGSNVKEIKRPAGGCPGSQATRLHRSPMEVSEAGSQAGAFEGAGGLCAERPAATSQLSQWPVQIKLVPVNAPYFDGANLLIAADCTAYAYGDFHNRFIRNRITLVGCPKLDEGDYTEKLTAIIRENNIKSVTIVRMEVPCCGGLERAAVQALKDSGKFIPWQVAVISTDGRIISE